MAKIYFDAGHGGYDPGAVGHVKESDVTIKVVQFACEHLRKKYDCEVYEDITADSLNTITRRANNWKADLFVSIHFNAGKGDGYEALVYSAANKKLGQHFEKYVKAVGQNSRGVKYRPGLAVLRDTQMKSIINEIAFVDNWNDIRDWNDITELKTMGEALAKAAASWVGAKEKVTSKPPQVGGVVSGTKVKIKSGAKDLNTGKGYADFVYKNTYSVISSSGNRVVFGLNGAVTGVTDDSNIIVVSAKEFKVRVKYYLLNIRSGAGTNYPVVGKITDKGVYTIIETNGEWGRLKSGAGWIWLNPESVTKL